MRPQDLIQGFQSLTPQKKFVVLFLIVSAIGGIAVFTLVANRPDFGILYANLEDSDSAEVVAKLQEKRIPYRLQAGGRAIEVPRNKIYELRLAMASEGISLGGVVGFELFDKDSWNMSRFAQEVNYRRALEGELARTIMSVDEVERARIHLVLPDKSAFFAAEDARPKASVVLKMRGSGRMQPGQVKGIVHLVSGSIEGLLPEDVSVIDTEGNLLTGGNKQDDGVAAISSYQLEYKQELESNLEQRVTRMLEKVVGSGNAIVRVSADVDFRKVERQEELYDPDSVVVRSEQKRSEKVGGGSATGAVPGVRANQPGGRGAAGTAMGQPSEKKEQVLNYEINKVVKRMVESPGAIQRLSVAVLVHKKEDTEETELPRLTSLVKGAIGFDEKRGDQVEVVLTPFDKSVEEGVGEIPAPGFLEVFGRVLPSLLKYGGLILGVFLLIFAVLRPLLKRLSEEGERLEAFQRRLPGSLEQIEKAIPEMTDKDKLMKLVQQDPSRAANIIKMWLREA
jgi:flagellar M-ring protein FliF